MRLALEKLGLGMIYLIEKVKYAMNLPLEAHIIATKQKNSFKKNYFSENLITLETGLLIFIISLMILKNFLKNRN